MHITPVRCRGSRAACGSLLFVCGHTVAAELPLCAVRLSHIYTTVIALKHSKMEPVGKDSLFSNVGQWEKFFCWFLCYSTIDGHWGKFEYYIYIDVSKIHSCAGGKDGVNKVVGVMNLSTECRLTGSLLLWLVITFVNECTGRGLTLSLIKQHEADSRHPAEISYLHHHSSFLLVRTGDRCCSLSSWQDGL